MGTRIYKIVDSESWAEARQAGVFLGAPVDRRDGFIHFSTAAQLAGTAAKHFAGRRGLLLIAFDSDDFGEALRWEPSRGGDLFPHLYAELDPSLADAEYPLPLAADGLHQFPARLA